MENITKKIRINNYKGNIIQSLQRVIDQFKDYSVVAASEAGDSLEVTIVNKSNIDESIFKASIDKLKNLSNAIRNNAEYVAQSLRDTFAKNKAIKKLITVTNKFPKKTTRLIIAIGEKYYPVINAFIDEKHAALVFGFEFKKVCDRDSEAAKLAITINDAVKFLTNENNEISKQVPFKIVSLKPNEHLSNRFDSMYCYPLGATEDQVKEIITQETKMEDIKCNNSICSIIYTQSQKDQNEEDVANEVWG